MERTTWIGFVLAASMSASVSADPGADQSAAMTRFMVEQARLREERIALQNEQRARELEAVRTRFEAEEAARQRAELTHSFMALYLVRTHLRLFGSVELCRIKAERAADVARRSKVLTKWIRASTKKAPLACRSVPTELLSGCPACSNAIALAVGLMSRAEGEVWLLEQERPFADHAGIDAKAASEESDRQVAAFLGQR